MRNYIVSPWMQPSNQAVSVLRMAGYCAVRFPSGRVEPQGIAGCAVTSDLEQYAAVVPAALLVAKEANIRASLDTLADRLDRHATMGWFVRTTRKGRHRARRILGLDWY